MCRRWKASSAVGQQELHSHLESLSLEKTFKISKYNHQPDIPRLITKPCPSVSHPCRIIDDLSWEGP